MSHYKNSFLRDMMIFKGNRSAKCAKYSMYA